MSKKDFDYIKQKYEAAMVDATASLDEKVIMDKINAQPALRAGKAHKRISFKAALSAAACFVLAAGVLLSVYPQAGRYLRKEGNLPVGQRTVATFGNYDEIYAYIAKADERAEEFRDLIGGITGVDGTAGFDASSTYVQVEGIDEADIIKVSGNYIYTQNSSSVFIYKAENGETEPVCEIDICHDKADASETVIKDFYVYDDVLAVNTCRKAAEYSAVTDSAESDLDSASACMETVVRFYDVSRPEKPEFISDFVQSGIYESSRLIGSTEYLITTHDTYAYADKAKIPYVAEAGERQSLAAENIAYMDNALNSAGTVVSAINIKTGKAAVPSKAVMGVSNAVYCSASSLYLTNFDLYCEKPYTQIIKLAVGDGSLAFTATAKVDGSILNQFSMDEKDGFFRVAVTANAGRRQVNCLYIFDEQLQPVGAVENFAEGEMIKSVCFMGDAAYVITFEEIDPLFVVDLSNPKAPRLKGSVEITGFSSELVPVDENKLLGIGYESLENENGSAIRGLKFALFDVSNPKAPAVLDSKVFEHAYSEAQYNHKAILKNAQKGYFAVPVYYDAGDMREVRYGILTVEPNGGRLHFTNEFACDIPADDYTADRLRCVYIDDYIYSAAGGAMLASYYMG